MPSPSAISNAVIQGLTLLLAASAEVGRLGRSKPGPSSRLISFGDDFTSSSPSASGGAQWPSYVAQYTGVGLTNYAQPNAVCSNAIVQATREGSTLFEAQMPQYYKDVEGDDDVGEALHTLWIGMNDMGSEGIMKGKAVNGASLLDVCKCMVNWVDILFKHGARRFLFMNMPPLDKAPRYALSSTSTNEQGFYHSFITQLTLSSNELMPTYLSELRPRLGDVSIGVFDAHGLLRKIYDDPKVYLNGTAALNVDTPIKNCVDGKCTEVQDSDARDSYLWFDDLHPSEQVSRIVAEQIAQVVKGQDNVWTKWL